MDARSSESFITVMDLKKDLIVYDESAGLFVPYLESLHFKANTLSFFLDSDKYADCQLELSSSEPISVFINNRLCYNFNNSGVNLIELDKLPIDGIVMFTVYGLHDAQSLSELRVVYPTFMRTTSNKDLNKIIIKTQDPFIDTVLVLLVLILFAYSMFRLLRPKVYTWYFGISKLLSNTTTDMNIIVSSFSNVVFLLLFINSIVLSFCINLYRFNGSDNSLVSLSTSSFIYQITFISVIIFIGFILKFILLRFIGALIGIQNLSKLHYFEFNRLITLISCALLPLSLATFYNGEIFTKITLFCFIILFLLAVLRIILVVNRESSFRIIYLFSYICTTEIVPVLILAKYFGFEHL